MLHYTDESPNILEFFPGAQRIRLKCPEDVNKCLVLTFRRNDNSATEQMFIAHNKICTKAKGKMLATLKDIEPELRNLHLPDDNNAGYWVRQENILMVNVLHSYHHLNDWNILLSVVCSFNQECVCLCAIYFTMIHIVFAWSFYRTLSEGESLLFH